MADDNGDALGTGVEAPVGGRLLTDAERLNFNRLLIAAATDRLMLVLCQDVVTKEPVAVIVEKIPPTVIGGGVGMRPVAQIFNGEGVDKVVPLGAEYGVDYDIKGRKLNG